MFSQCMDYIQSDRSSLPKRRSTEVLENLELENGRGTPVNTTGVSDRRQEANGVLSIFGMVGPNSQSLSKVRTFMCT